MKTYYPFRKEFPELDLKLICDEDSGYVIFSGKKTPKKYIGVDTMSSYIDEKFHIFLGSQEYPDFCPHGGMSLNIYVGGRQENQDTFIVEKHIEKSYFEYFNKAFIRNFKLNSNITIL